MSAGQRGASLIPSPTIATLRRSRDEIGLLFRQQLA